MAAKISELEQRIQVLTGSDGAALSCLSPSQILLNGYSSATVDLDLSEEIKKLKASSQSEMSDSGGVGGRAGLAARTNGVGHCLEGTSSNTSQGLPTELLSSESNKSLPSCSELGDPDFGHESSSDFTSNAEETTGGILLEPYINADRNLRTNGASTLPELPPEIAELVRQLSESIDDGGDGAN